MQDILIIDQDLQKRRTTDLPGANRMLLIAILSLSFVVGILGLLLARKVLRRSSEALALYSKNPSEYSERSLRKVRAARVIAISSISLFCLMIVLILSVNA